MSYDGLLNRTCTIQRKTVTYGNRGQESTAWADLATGVDCRIQARTGKLSPGLKGEDLEARFIGFLKYAQAINEGDRVVYQGITLTVKRVDDAAGHGHHKEVILQYLSGEEG